MKNVCFLHFVRELLHGVYWAGWACGKADGEEPRWGRGGGVARGGEGENKFRDGCELETSEIVRVFGLL